MGAPTSSSRSVSRYRLRKKLFRDDTGTVYLARHTELGRDVTIKLVPIAENAASATWGEVHSRFLREAQGAGRLRHPNILSVWDAGEHDGFLYIVMDHISGDRLDAYTDPDALLPVATVHQIGLQIAAALDYAHRQNVIHRDVKPLNIIFSPGNKGAVLTGFGIARILDSSLTKTGTVRGSPSYMPPEQVMGRKVTSTADIYSLGVTLFQLCSGWLPFVGSSITDLMEQIVSKNPRKLLDIRAELPLDLAGVIEKALAKDPAARYQSGEQMLQALRECNVGASNG